MSKSVNPFNPGSGTPPPYLAGRDDEMEKFFAMLKSITDGKSENMMVHGLRGVGKTVLLRKMASACIDKGFVPIMNLMYTKEVSDPKVFIKLLQHDVDKAINDASKMDKLKRQVREFGKYARPKEVAIPGILSYKPAYGSDDDGLLLVQMMDYLTAAYEPLKSTGINGIVFLLDEFHTIQNIEAKGWYTLSTFIGVVNELQNQGLRYSLVLCGLPPMVTHVKNARSYSERMFRTLREISNLDEDAAKSAILEPLKESNWTFSDGLISSILRDTGRYPYFIQFFSKEIIDLVDKPRIDVDDYERVRAGILEKLDSSFFGQRMASLTGGQSSVLRAMASIPKQEVDFTAIHSKTEIKKGTVSNNLRQLEEKGLVYRSGHGIYRFSMPLFRRYIMDRYASEDVGEPEKS